MPQLQLTMPDGSVKAYDRGATGLDVALSISPRLAKAALAVKVNGQVMDLTAGIDIDAPIEILTFDQPEGKQVFWHSSAHIMAQAVQELFPGVKLAIGPAIDVGWYYDFDVPEPFSPADLERIEKKMKEII
ncbi:MAG: TGS domain-containing protein, partial [candidate division Zixibacteria bacterium]|nr:TGS domain-containing protein [candidate division Zixibacteria bacterium]